MAAPNDKNSKSCGRRHRLPVKLRTWRSRLLTGSRPACPGDEAWERESGGHSSRKRDICQTSSSARFNRKIRARNRKWTAPRGRPQRQRGAAGCPEPPAGSRSLTGKAASFSKTTKPHVPTIRFKFSARTLDGVRSSGRDGEILTHDIHVSLSSLLRSWKQLQYDWKTIKKWNEVGLVLRLLSWEQENCWQL